MVAKIYQWDANEDEILRDRCGTEPIDKITCAINAYNRRSGRRVVRTITAARSRAAMLNLSCRTIDDYVSLNYLADLLGTHRIRVGHWVKQGLKVARTGGCLRFRIGKVAQFIKRNPDLFAGLDAAGLFWILEDRELADEIAQSPYGKFRLCKQGDSRTYGRISEAARSWQVHQGRLYYAIRNNRCEVDGVQFEVLSA